MAHIFDTVDELTPRKAEQNKARAAAEYAYSGRKWNVASDIYSAYKTPSAAKVSAWNDCIKYAALFGGRDICISSHNSMKFSVVFRYTEEQTGAECVCYITRDYTRHAYA